MTIAEINCYFKDDHVMPAGHEPGSIGMVRRVVLHKDPEHGLGLAVVGGKQLGVPILGRKLSY